MMLNMSLIGKMMMVSMEAMKAQSERLLVVAQNLANAGTRAPSPSTEPYRRKTITFHTRYDRKRGVDLLSVRRVARDPSDFPITYKPGDPGANADGYVQETNVKAPIEMTDAMETRRGYEANLKAYEYARSMRQDSLALLRSVKA